MKRYLIPLSFLCLVVIPNLICTLFMDSRAMHALPTETIEFQSVDRHTVLLERADEIVEIDLDTYVLSVLLGEVPASFHLEALKAQAVAIRTYTLYHCLDNKHAEAQLCDDATCCQAYVQPQTYLNMGHTQAELDRMMTAVESTLGQVITYKGEIIDATYFSCSGGRTEDAAAVWGKEVPYLVSVDSPGEEFSETYEKTTTIPKNQFLIKLGLEENRILDSRDISVTYSNNNSIVHIQVFDRTFSATDLRKLLDLPSAEMKFEITEESVEITTKGSGHRVGLSQYGAQAMALRGSAYDEILTHYYSDTVLTSISNIRLDSI